MLRPEPRLHIKPERLSGRRKAVTIGVGFLCTDGVVICADRQLTGDAGYKFDESKLFHSIWTHRRLVFSYAGDPDAAQIMFRETNDNLDAEMAKIKSGSHSHKAHTALQRLFNNNHAKGLQTLIGLRFEHSPCSLFKTSDKKVVEGLRECIGAGDGSAIRYVCDFLLRGNLTVHEAEIIGSYIVSVANRFVDRCSGGPDVVAIHSHGGISESTVGVFPMQQEVFLRCEEQMGKAFRELLFSGGTKGIIT